jgi:hypothetical protein
MLLFAAVTFSLAQTGAWARPTSARVVGLPSCTCTSPKWHFQPFPHPSPQRHFASAAAPMAREAPQLLKKSRQAALARAAQTGLLLAGQSLAAMADFAGERHPPQRVRCARVKVAPWGLRGAQQTDERTAPQGGHPARQKGRLLEAPDRRQAMPDWVTVHLGSASATPASQIRLPGSFSGVRQCQMSFRGLGAERNSSMRVVLLSRAVSRPRFRLCGLSIRWLRKAMISDGDTLADARAASPVLALPSYGWARPSAVELVVMTGKGAIQPQRRSAAAYAQPRQRLCRRPAYGRAA